MKQLDRRTFRLLILGCLAISSLLSSCQTEKDPTPDQQPACKLVKRYDQGNVDNHSLFEYNKQGQLSSLTHYQNGKILLIITYKYNGKGQIVNHLQTNFNLADPSSSPDTITCGNQYNSQGLVTSYNCISSIDSATTVGNFEYDTEGNRVITTTERTIRGVIYKTVALFEYKDGNCVKAIGNPGTPNESIAIQEFYLDQENKSRQESYRFLTTNAGPNKNMLKKQTYIFKDGLTFTYSYTYQYNEQGYPNREYLDYLQDNTLTSRVLINEYNCQYGL